MPPNQDQVSIQNPIEVEHDFKKEAYKTLKHFGKVGLILLPFIFLSGFALDDPDPAPLALIFPLSLLLYFPVYLFSVFFTIIFANLHLKRLTRYVSHLPMVNIIGVIAGLLLWISIATFNSLFVQG